MKRNESMRSTVWFMTVFVASGFGGDVPRLPADTGSAATSPVAQFSATTNAPPPDLQAFPTAPAPGELAAVLLPETERTVSALIQRLPLAVAGHQQSSAVRPSTSGALVVGYGEDRRRPWITNPFVRLQVIDLRRGDFFPTNWTAGQVVGFMALAKHATDVGRDGDLFWLRDETAESLPGSTDQIVTYGVTWGRIDSPWLFSIQGDTSESRDALLTAVVAIANRK
jgi:hypothetical protein